MFSQNLIDIPITLPEATDLCKQLRKYSGEAWRKLSPDIMYNYKEYAFWIVTPQVSRKDISKISENEVKEIKADIMVNR